MIVEMLGTGTSHGVPRIGCDCPVCTSLDPKDKRMRSSIWVHDKDVSVVIDTGPEFRLQAVRARIKHLDAVFYTHNHADHLNGIDDLRAFTEQKSLKVYGPVQVLEDIERRFSYAVGNNPWHGGLPQLQLAEVPIEGITVGSLTFIPIPLVHGCREVFGYRIGNFAYLSDCKKIPENSIKLLGGIDTIVIDALRKDPHPTHMNVQEALEAARNLGAKEVYLTHMTHRLSHADLERSLPQGCHPAYDGLIIDL